MLDILIITISISIFFALHKHRILLPIVSGACIAIFILVYNNLSYYNKILAIILSIISIIIAFIVIIISAGIFSTLIDTSIYNLIGSKNIDLAYHLGDIFSGLISIIIINYFSRCKLKNNKT